MIFAVGRGESRPRHARVVTVASRAGSCPAAQSASTGRRAANGDRRDPTPVNSAARSAAASTQRNRHDRRATGADEPPPRLATMRACASWLAGGPHDGRLRRDRRAALRAALRRRGPGGAAPRSGPSPTDSTDGLTRTVSAASLGVVSVSRSSVRRAGCDHRQVGVSRAARRWQQPVARAATDRPACPRPDGERLQRRHRRRRAGGRGTPIDAGRLAGTADTTDGSACPHAASRPRASPIRTGTASSPRFATWMRTASRSRRDVHRGLRYDDLQPHARRSGHDARTSVCRDHGSPGWRRRRHPPAGRRPGTGRPARVGRERAGLRAQRIGLRLRGSTPDAVRGRRRSRSLSLIDQVRVDPSAISRLSSRPSRSCRWVLPEAAVEVAVLVGVPPAGSRPRPNRTRRRGGRRRSRPGEGRSAC